MQVKGLEEGQAQSKCSINISSMINISSNANTVGCRRWPRPLAPQGKYYSKETSPTPGLWERNLLYLGMPTPESPVSGIDVFSSLSLSFFCLIEARYKEKCAFCNKNDARVPAVRGGALESVNAPQNGELGSHHRLRGSDARVFFFFPFFFFFFVK